MLSAFESVDLEYFYHCRVPLDSAALYMRSFVQIVTDIELSSPWNQREQLKGKKKTKIQVQKHKLASIIRQCELLGCASDIL